MQTKLQKNIMRRVYYAYTLSFLSESMLWQGMVLGACVALFGRLTHVAAIVRNLEAVQLGNVPHYVLVSFEKALTHGEFLTALVAVAMGAFAISVAYRVAGIISRSVHPHFA